MAEKKLNIYQKINAVMQEVKAIQKEDKKVNGQYTFVSHDAVSGALHLPLANHGIVMVPTISELKQDGNRTEAKMEIAFVNADDPNDKIVVQYFGYGIDASDKGIGKAVSYAVKYALLKVFCLETGDDVEKENIKHEPSPVPVDNVKDHKSKLWESVEKDPLVTNYLQEISKALNITIDDVVMNSQDLNKFTSEFYTWKKHQKKSAISKAA